LIVVEECAAKNGSYVWDYSIFATVSRGEKRSHLIASARKFSSGYQRRKSMSALNIIVGGWLVLNAVVVVALTLRHDETPVGWEK
jgi:hypothetical protein